MYSFTFTFKSNQVKINYTYFSLHYTYSAQIKAAHYQYFNR